jgi:hypothetical protein
MDHPAGWRLGVPTWRERRSLAAGIIAVTVASCRRGVPSMRLPPFSYNPAASREGSGPAGRGVRLCRGAPQRPSPGRRAPGDAVRLPSPDPGRRRAPPCRMRASTRLRPPSIQSWPYTSCDPHRHAHAFHRGTTRAPRIVLEVEEEAGAARHPPNQRLGPGPRRLQHSAILVHKSYCNLPPRPRIICVGNKFPSHATCMA